MPAVEVWATHHGLPHVVGMRRGRGGVFGGVGIPATRALEIKGRLCPGGRALPVAMRKYPLVATEKYPPLD